MIAKDFFNYKKWCVVGDVVNTAKYAHKILNKLESNGFEVSGVNPKGGEGVYSSLEEVPYEIEVIDLCINSFMGMKIVEEANKLGIDKILIQPGAESEAILNYCKENGIEAIEGCVLVELNRK